MDLLYKISHFQEKIKVLLYSNVKRNPNKTLEKLPIVGLAGEYDKNSDIFRYITVYWVYTVGIFWMNEAFSTWFYSS